MLNRFDVGAVGKKITIANLAPRPTLTPKEALELGAWLVATALPLQPGDAGAELGNFLKLVGDAAGEGEVADAIESELADG